MLGYLAEAVGALGFAVLGLSMLGHLPADAESALVWAFSALLPNKLGVRTGVQAGGLLAPVLVGHYSSWTEWPEMTRWPQGFVHGALHVLSYQRLISAVVGGLCGAIAFVYVGDNRRLLGNISAAVIGGLSVTALAALAFFANAVMMTHGHPSRFIWLVQGFLLGAVFIVATGVAFGTTQRLAEKFGDLFRERRR